MRALLVGLVMALPMTATAQNPICAPTGEIVAAAVEARKAGQGAEAGGMFLHLLRCCVSCFSYTGCVLVVSCF